MSKRPCASPGCGELVVKGYCPRHAPIAAANKRESERMRGRMWTSKVYDGDWRRVRAEHLKREPACRGCGRSEGVTLEVHHKLSVRERPDLRLDPGNLLTACTSCHARLERQLAGQRR